MKAMAGGRKLSESLAQFKAARGHIEAAQALERQLERYQQLRAPDPGQVCELCSERKPAPSPTCALTRRPRG